MGAVALAEEVMTAEDTTAGIPQEAAIVEGTAADLEGMRLTEESSG